MKHLYLMIIKESVEFGSGTSTDDIDSLMAYLKIEGIV